MCVKAETVMRKLAERIMSEVKASDEGLGDGDWMLLWDLATEEIGPDPSWSDDADCEDYEYECEREARMYELAQDFQRILNGEMRVGDIERVLASPWLLDEAEMALLAAHRQWCVAYVRAA